MTRPIADTPQTPNTGGQWRRPIARGDDGHNVVRLFAPAQKPVAEPNPIDRHVGGRLRMQRLARGMSQQKLAAALGVGVARLQRLEAGERRIDAYLFRDLVRILDAPASFFFSGLPPEPPKPSSE